MSPPHQSTAFRIQPDTELTPQGPGTSQSLVVPAGTLRDAHPSSVSDALVSALEELGVTHAFGVIGGGIAPFCAAVARSSIRLLHCRSEAGAAFAAIESSLATGRLSVVVATTGPGLTSLLTGMAAARSEGAHVLFVSGATSPSQRGRGAFQETSAHGNGLGSLFVSGPLLHHAQVVEHAAEIGPLCARLTIGAASPLGFVAHIGLPLNVQTAQLDPPWLQLSRARLPVPDAAVIDRCRRLLKPGRFAIWVGFGARNAAAEVLAFAERMSAVVMSSPRAKGVMPENHPLYLGVTGLGGHAEVERYLGESEIERVLVLGSRLGELTSFWSKHFAPSEGFLHVDLEPNVFGAAFPHVPTLGVQADVGDFLRALLQGGSASTPKASIPPVHAPFTESVPRPGSLVRYSALLSAIQRRVVEETDAVVLTEAGNSFMLGSHYLAFETAGRYRVSTQFGSMGQASAGVLGAALAQGKAVALVGDGALLMFNELSTAAKYGIAAVWIVLNDARYGMIEDGMVAIGWEPFETDFPRTDFVAVAQAMGVAATRVECELDLDVALLKAVEAQGPYLLDVWIDPSEHAPSNRRNGSLVDQGVNGGAVAQSK